MRLDSESRLRKVLLVPELEAVIVSDLKEEWNSLSCPAESSEGL